MYTHTHTHTHTHTPQPRAALRLAWPDAPCDLRLAPREFSPTYVCIHMYIYMYNYIYVCIYMYINEHICTYNLHQFVVTLKNPA